MMQRQTRLQLIARKLAEKEPLWYPRKGSAICALCEGGSRPHHRTVEHEPGCPWVLARDYIAENDPNQGEQHG